MDDINLEDYFDVVIEPEHSKNVLLNFQKKYGYDSVKLYTLYKQEQNLDNYLNIDKEDFHSWIHHFIIFTQNGGDVSDLGDDWNLKLDDNKWEDSQNELKNIDMRGENNSPLFYFL